MVMPNVRLYHACMCTRIFDLNLIVWKIFNVFQSDVAWKCILKVLVFSEKCHIVLNDFIGCWICTLKRFAKIKMASKMAATQLSFHYI